MNAHVCAHVHGTHIRVCGRVSVSIVCMYSLCVSVCLSVHSAARRRSSKCCPPYKNQLNRVPANIAPSSRLPAFAHTSPRAFRT